MARADHALRPKDSFVLHEPVKPGVEQDEDMATHVSDELVMRALWTDDSTELEYVRGHAQRMLARVRREDPHSAYIPLRSKSTDVRLFKVATLVAETPLEHERCDFRGVTRVPGSIETVLGLLASEDERESYWIALNTQRGLLVHSLVATRRLDGNAPFPRWNQRYSAIKFSKQSPPVECCVGEYAAFYPDEDDDDELASKRARVASQDTVSPDGSPLRRAYVYRRSMDHRLFNMEDVQEKLSKYGETCERLYLQDFLFEISETPEKHICKVVLTCSAYITNNAQVPDEKTTKSMRHEFREFSTNMLLSLRQVLANQWVEHMANAGVVGSSPTNLLSRSLGRRVAGQPAHCGVCSTAFSLLKKRNVCRSCSLVVCSRCCTRLERANPLAMSGHQRSASSLDLNSRRATKECILCGQFGSDGGEARVSVSIRHHFTSSTLSSARSMTATLSDAGDETERLSNSFLSNNQDDDDEEDVRVVATPEDLDTPRHDDDDRQDAEDDDAMLPTKPRNLRVRAATEDNTVATGWREPESELPPARRTPTRRTKLRCESVNIPNAREKGGPGVVLLSDIDTLSLTGSFHRVSLASSCRRSSGGSDMGSTGTSVMRASAPLPPTRPPPPPPMPPRRAFRSVSDDTTLPVKLEAQPQQADELDLDDLANFNLQLL